MRFYRACTDRTFHTQPLFGSRVLGLEGSKLRLYCFVPYKQHPKSAIYKLTSGHAGWLAQHCISIVLCPPNNTQSSMIYKLTDRLQGCRPQDCDCLRMVIPVNYITLSKNIIFNIKLLILNIDIVQFNQTKKFVQYETGKRSVGLVI